MWPFRSLANVNPNTVAALATRVETLEKATKVLMDDLSTLEDKHVRLRGKVYAHKLHRPDDDDAETPKPVDKMTRDELRRHLLASGRFMPGRPAKHD